MTERSDLVTSYEEGNPLIVRSDHGCFGCGRLNACGLRLTFSTLPGARGTGVWAAFTPQEPYEGYTGVVHGGIISTVLDEIMAWALYERGIWAVTAQLAVRFRRPIAVGTPTRAIGRLTADRGRLVETSGEIRAMDDALLASASGVFVRVPPEQAAAWAARYLASPDQHPPVRDDDLSHHRASDR
jgi:acyl-coenzyme A thioesterase PaaI-like protein